ncbi:MAG TPA: hypothetical protein VK463_11100 [Desulfomonilaceae bacterium]|nr:hypothetical protein [Desulfomonilaceae bacterium]
MSRPFAVLSLILTIVFQVSHASTASDSSPCPEEYAQWRSAYEQLAHAVDSLRETKQETIEPRINSLLADDKRLSVAQNVQVVLKERNRRIEEAGSKGIEAANREKWAFEQLRKCGLSDSPKRSHSPKADLNGVVRERNRLLTELQELMAEEAYVQYKRESPNPPSQYSGSGIDHQSAQNQNTVPGPARRNGYGSYAPGYYQ